MTAIDERLRTSLADRYRVERELGAGGVACASLWRYGISMAHTVKMTFTLDDDTVRRIDRTALRLDIPKSAVVREAVAEYAARAGRLSEQERRRMLKVFDDVIERIPLRQAKTTDAELAAIRRARRQGGRRTASSTSK